MGKMSVYWSAGFDTISPPKIKENEVYLQILFNLRIDNTIVKSKLIYYLNGTGGRVLISGEKINHIRMEEITTRRIIKYHTKIYSVTMSTKFRLFVYQCIYLYILFALHLHTLKAPVHSTIKNVVSYIKML